MVTLVLPRLAARAERRFQRAAAVTGRNVAAARHFGYWWVLVSGFFEPVLYLMSIGVGVGALIKSFTLPDGRTISYAAFVAPAMLAASAMNGALAETTMNFFGKMKYMRLYDAVLATPVQPFEVALGELMWALIRGSIYSIAFLGLMVAMGLTSAGWALAALPATVIVGFAFGGMGMAMATFVRSWQDFDYIMVVQFGLFLFSGTFAPAGSYPWIMKIVVGLTPLYHGVELLRGLTTGVLGWGLLGHTAYLVAFASVGLAIASRRMALLLYK
ncbi:MAG TPA: ABC transporter permease [Planosporangium sp.]|jgi:lipooligosaccharide transport system permease protein|nr:ABC transporter permease [Planosporangium sp.]